MAKTNALAICKCPECGFPDAEIKRAKNNTAYRFCPDCSAQYFTQSKEKSDRLFASVGLDSNGEKIQPEPQKIAVTGTEQKPSKPINDFGL